MVYGKFLSPLDDISECINIRRSEFTNPDIDEKDGVSMHLLVFDNSDNPVASGRIRIDDGIYIAENIVVLPQYRRKGYGDLALRMLVNRAFENNADCVFAKCNASITGFLKKVGFSETDGLKEYGDDCITEMILKRESFIFPCHSCPEKQNT